MSLLGKLHEFFSYRHDESRDALYSALQAHGIQASMSERGRPEEEITSKRGKSLGVIDIECSPISWVNIKYHFNGGPFSCAKKGGSGFGPPFPSIC